MYKVFKQMNCLRFANIMNNTTIINTFKIDISNIAKSKTQPCQIMATITNRILKFEPIIKILIVTNYALFTIISFSKINFVTYINFIVIQHL